MSSGAHLSKELLDLVKSIGESRSKQEEDKIITGEAQLLKTKFLERNLPEKKMRELLIRAIYVEMLGHDASFSHIHAVNLTQSKNLLVKRIGYLACSLFIDKSNDLIILMIATIQKDLQSRNHLEVMAALNVLAKLPHSHIIMAVADAVAQLMSHAHEMIRKKAVMVLMAFNKVQPQDQFDMKMKRALCDKDPSVMAASLNYFQEEVRQRPDDFKDLVPSFIVILKQVTDHRLPRDFDYHRMPAPWIQSKILEILGFLSADDKENSEKLYETLGNVLKKADDMGINIGYALVYQCLRTITMIIPHQPLIDLASQTIARFLSSQSHNLKYIGITGLASIVKIDPKYTLSYQSLVVDCLEDTDDTLKVKTLDLLFKMTNKQNVEPIVDRLLSYLKEAPIEAGSRKDLVIKISSLGDKFAPNQNWYVRNMNKLFEIGGDQITSELTNRFIQSISEYERDEVGDKFRDTTIKIYLKILKKNPNIPDALMQVIAWILGEYGSNQADTEKVRKILNLLSQFSYGTFEEEQTRACILLALTRLHSSLAFEKNDYIEQIMNDFSSSRHLAVQQRAFDYLVMKQKHNELPNNGKDLIFRVPLTEKQVTQENFDFNLSFLDPFVAQAVSEGKRDYDTERSQAVGCGDIDGLVGAKAGVQGLNYTPYQQANIGVTKTSQNLQQSNPMFNQTAGQTTGAPSVSPGGAPGIQGQTTISAQQSLTVTNVKKVWGSVQEEAKTAAPVAGQGVQQHVESHYKSSNNLNTSSTPAAGAKAGKADVPKEDKKKTKAMNALFSGIQDGEKSEESGSDSDSDDTPKKAKSEKKPEAQEEKPAEMADLLGFDAPAQQNQQPGGGDLFGLGVSGGAPQQPAPVQPPYTPTQITTPQFGGSWGANTIEKRLDLTIPHLGGTAAYAQALSSKLGFQVVEVINNEVISAANVPNAVGQQILLHCRVNPGGVLNFTFRSNSQAEINALESTHLLSLAQQAPQSQPAPSSNPLDGLF